MATWASWSCWCPWVLMSMHRWVPHAFRWSASGSQPSSIWFRTFVANRNPKLSHKPLKFLLVSGALQWPNCPPSRGWPAESRPGVALVEVWGWRQQGHLPGLLPIPAHLGPPKHPDTAAAGPADPREPSDAARERGWGELWHGVRVHRGWGESRLTCSWLCKMEEERPFSLYLLRPLECLLILRVST